MEKFSANLMVQGGGAPAGRSTRLNMDVQHWATESDLAGFKKILTEGGPSALHQALAGRNAGWIVIGASIFTSNIGSEHIVGLAGQGATTGLAMAHWELHAWVLIMLAGVFVPFY